MRCRIWVAAARWPQPAVPRPPDSATPAELSLFLDPRAGKAGTKGPRVTLNVRCARPPSPLSRQLCPRESGLNESDRFQSIRQSLSQCLPGAVPGARSPHGTTAVRRVRPACPGLWVTCAGPAASTGQNQPGTEFRFSSSPLRRCKSFGPNPQESFR